LFMTLPGQVFSIYIHADREGVDYLSGNYDINSNMVNSTGLYTLRFSDPLPRLLHSSPEGGITWPTWSSDGRLLAFDFQLPDPGEFQSRIGWIDMNCRSTGECPVNILDAPLNYRLGVPEFSPEGTWLAINGADTTYGAGEIYLLPFNVHVQPGLLQNFTSTGLVDDGNINWIAGNQLTWGCTDPNATDPNKERRLKKSFLTATHSCLEYPARGATSGNPF
jgi:WD40-like Beta Propeller Repeat